MPSIALFSDDIELRDMLNQLDGWRVAYFSLDLNANQLPNNIGLVVFDFDVVPLSLIDELDQFARLHLHRIGVVSPENLNQIDDVLARIESYIVRPLSPRRLEYSLNSINPKTELSELIAVLRSDIKSPLTAIKGYTELLRQSEIDISQQQETQFLTNILANAERITLMIDSYADWINYGHNPNYYFSSQNIESIIDNALENLRFQFESKSQIVDKKVMIEIPMVIVDERKILFVIESLLRNASMYSPEQSMIRIETNITERSMVIHVTDKGIGISDEYSDDVFSLFLRESKPDVYDQFGMGISLHICKQIIEKHGGYIWFESEVGVGTTFYFTLPLTE